MLVAQASAWGVALGDLQVDKLLRFAGLLSSYEEANVVGERNVEALVLDHVLDSLSCALALEKARTRILIDVGSGGGLPGIPLAIALPDAHVTLLEATGKKVTFLELATERLGLENVDVVSGRAEDLGRGRLRDRYDVATSRAVASLPVIEEYCLPLLRTGGLAVAMKGQPPDDELAAGKNAAEELGGSLREVVSVPQLAEMPERRRCLVVVEKETKTPEGYPRRPGLARKRPLGGP